MGTAEDSSSPGDLSQRAVRFANERDAAAWWLRPALVKLDGPFLSPSQTPELNR